MKNKNILLIGGTGTFGKVILEELYKKEFNTRLEAYPVATSYSDRILSIPLYPRMSTQDVERVSNVVVDLVSRNRR